MKQDRIRRATVWLMSAFAMMIMPLLNSCNSEELLTKTAAEENAEWHFSIDADRSGGVETRALTEKENMLQSSWNHQNDYIYVYNKSKELYIRFKLKEICMMEEKILEIINENAGNDLD